MDSKNNLKTELDRIESNSLEVSSKIIPFSTKPRRTKISSLGDVLNVVKEGGREGVIISIISRHANLAHYMALEKCYKLTLAGLIEEKFFGKRKVYVITEKGLDFLNEYGNFQRLVGPLNLKF